MSSCEEWEFEHKWEPVAPILQDRRKAEGKGPWKNVPVQQREGLIELQCSNPGCGTCKVEKRSEPSSTY